MTSTRVLVKVLDDADVLRRTPERGKPNCRISAMRGAGSSMVLRSARAFSFVQVFPIG